MRRGSAALCALICLVCACLPIARGERTLGDEARDITASCAIRLSYNRNDKARLTDGRVRDYWRSGKKGWLEITTPTDEPCYGLYIKWAGDIADCVIETQSADGAWTRAADLPKEKYYNQYVPMDGLTHFRVKNTSDTEMCVAEITVLSKGALPDFVQVWQPFTGKADLMVLSAHPDDEILFMGGIIPYYRGQQGKKVIVCYLVKQPASRKSELLDGLWLCGVREYPEMPAAQFADISGGTVRQCLAKWKEDALIAHVTTLIRRYRPDVLVTHDVNGEYGHVAHKVCALIAQRSLKPAADERYGAASFAQYGAWRVKKTYLHLWGDDDTRIVFDWRQPLSAFGGQTAFDIACQAFKMHRTQQGGRHEVKDFGEYSNAVFGLYDSTVGADEKKDDLFEHIP